MKKYQVTIEAVIRKTYIVEAENETTAQEFANEMFNVLNEPDVDEYYSQEILNVCEREQVKGESNHGQDF